MKCGAQEDFKKKIDKNDINSFEEIILSVFNKYIPVKKKYIQENEAPITTKKTCIKKL